MFKPGKNYIGGFSTNDGTIDFYLRVRSLLNGGEHIVDYGAGRGSWFEDDECKTRVKLRDFRDVAASVIAIDVDSAVFQHRASTDQKQIVDGCTMLDDSSIDCIVSDFVLEHVDDVKKFTSEINRILKPGGLFCARTPHARSYVAIISSLISNRYHSRLLQFIQPTRKEIDVFPTRYKLNSIDDLNAAFYGWENCSLVYSAEPAYFLGRKMIFRFMNTLHALLPSKFYGNLFVFMRKPK